MCTFYSTPMQTRQCTVFVPNDDLVHVHFFVPNEDLVGIFNFLYRLCFCRILVQTCAIAIRRYFFQSQLQGLLPSSSAAVQCTCFTVQVPPPVVC